MDKSELEKLWKDPANWNGWFYFCKKDPRFWVPKKPEWAGWTINFGHRAAPWVLLGWMIFMGALPGIVAILAASPK